MGLCCVFGPPLVVVGQHFNEKRSLANGLTTAGGSLGQLSLPLFTTYLLDFYGFTGALLLFGAFALHTIPAAALFRPPSFYARDNSKNKELKLDHCEGTNQATLDSETNPNDSKNIKLIVHGSQKHLNNLNTHIANEPIAYLQESQSLMSSKSEHTGLNNSEKDLTKTRVNQLMKSTSQSSLKHWMGSVSSLNPLKHKHQLSASTASLSVLEYQKVPADTWMLEQQRFVSNEISIFVYVPLQKLTSVRNVTKCYRVN